MNYEKLVLVVVMVWVKGEIGEVVDLYFQVCFVLSYYVYFGFKYCY